MRLVVCFVVFAILVAPVAGLEPSDGLSRELELFLDARLAEVSGDYQEALELYALALKEAPENVEIRVSYAALLNQAGMSGRAVGLLEGRSDLDWYGRRTLAQVLARLGARQPEYLGSAAEELRAVLEERPEDPNVELNLAQVLMMLRRPAEAEPIVRKLREGRADDLRLIELHARVMDMLGRHDVAIELFDQCSQPPGAGERCRERLLELLQDVERYAEAGERILDWSGSQDVESRLEAAALLLRGARPEEALRAVRGALAVDAESPVARRLEASALAELGRVGEAIESFRRLTRSDPNDVETGLLLAWWLGRAGRLAEAREELDRIWGALGADDPTSLRVRCSLTGARVELAADNVTAAREWLNRIEAPALAGTDLPRLLAETYRRREAWRDGVGALLRLQPVLEAEARIVAIALEGELRLRAGDDRGLRRLEELQNRSLHGAEVALSVLQTVERWDEAERMAARALERYPGESSLRFVRGAALERLGRFDEAVAMFEAVLETDPRHAPSANYLGYMWADAGVRLDEALELIQTAVEERPNDAAYLDSLGWVYFRLGNLLEAERWLRRAVEGAGSDGTVFGHLGEVLLALGREEQAREMLQRALSLGCEEPGRVRELLESMGTDAP